MNILSIDIGLKGGIVLSKDYNIVKMLPMPIKVHSKSGKNIVDVEKLYITISDTTLDTPIDLFLFEDLHSLKKAGKIQTWSFGYQCGIMEAMAVFFRFKYMATPAKEWQEVICKDIPPLRKKDGKIDTKARAYLAYKKLYPTGNLTKSKDGIIDALLINHYGMYLLNK